MLEGIRAGLDDSFQAEVIVALDAILTSARPTSSQYREDGIKSSLRE